MINVKKKLVHISDSVLNKVQVVKVKVPPGFPTGGTLKSEVLKASTELGDLKGTVNTCINNYVLIIIIHVLIIK